jgi:uncharacterized protein DUF3313
VAWGKYDQFQNEPSSYEPANSRESLKTEDAEKLTTFFDTKLQSFYKAQVPASGATLKIKPVITGVRRSRPIVNLIGFALVPVPLSYGGASVHYDLIDAASGERVGVVTGRHRGASLERLPKSELPGPCPPCAQRRCKANQTRYRWTTAVGRSSAAVVSSAV